MIFGRDDYSDEPQPGEVYLDGGRYCYHCKWCCYGFSTGNDARADEMADAHEAQCTLKP